MTYKYVYETPGNFSNMIMNSDGEYLTGLWFENSRDSSKHIIDCEEKNLEVFTETKKWLDTYFSGKNPNFTPKYKIEKLTPFTLSYSSQSLLIVFHVEPSSGEQSFTSTNSNCSTPILFSSLEVNFTNSSNVLEDL